MNIKSVVGLVGVSTLLLGWVLFNSDEQLVEISDEAVQSFTLSNGLKILVIENHRAPVVVSQIWYKVGASYEHDGITGVSHVLEHRLELCLELEADRMRNLVLEEKDFLKEVEVVKEERRLRTDDKPTALTYERFNAVAYTNSPYRRPIIGWMEDLDTLTIEDVRSWYKTWYAPNNATLVVAGDVQAGDVFRLAKQYFGQLSVSEIPETKPRREAKQYGTQRLTVEVPAKIPYLVMGYKAPVYGQVEDKWEVYALEVLAGVLDGGDSARLSKNLVRGQQIASSAGASYGMTGRHETLFVLSAIPNDEVAIDVIEFALREEVNVLKTQLADEKELQRIKAQVVAEQVFMQDSTFYQAMEVGTLETIGLPWQLKDEYVENILAVTAEQVKQVANKYLTDDRLTVAVLDPLPLSNGKNNNNKNLQDADVQAVVEAE